MKGIFRRTSAVIVLSTLLSGIAHAATPGNCGAGKILAVKEGGWSGNDLLIRIDYSGNHAGDNIGERYHGWIRFSSTDLDIKRFNGIKALTYLAFAGDKSVSINSHNESCAFATEITIVEDGQEHLF